MTTRDEISVTAWVFLVYAFYYVYIIVLCDWKQCDTCSVAINLSDLPCDSCHVIPG